MDRRSFRISHWEQIRPGFLHSRRQSIGSQQILVNWIASSARDLILNANAESFRPDTAVYQPLLHPCRSEGRASHTRDEINHVRPTEADETGLRTGTGVRIRRAQRA